MVRLLAGALALALFIAPAHAAGPLVRGKCWCGIATGKFSADCGSSRVTCTKPMCEAACRARVPAKTSRGAYDPWTADRPERPGHDFHKAWSESAQSGDLTDVSAARRMARGGNRARGAGMAHARYRGDSGRARRGVRATAGMDVARAAQTDRDGRGYAAPASGVSAPIRAVTHRRALGVARAAVSGAAIGGSVAVEYSRPRDCYGIAWCGCWLRHALGIPDRGLNLAIAWARVGAPASPDSANVVVWRHHVGKLLAHEGGRILVQSGNDRGAVRTRWLSPHVLGGVVAYRRV